MCFKASPFGRGGGAATTGGLPENRAEEYDLHEKNDKIGENIMKITVVCEYNASMSSPEGVAAYPEGLGECLKEMFSSFGYETVLHLRRQARTRSFRRRVESNRRSRLVGTLVSRLRRR